MTSSYFEQFQYHTPFNIYIISNLGSAIFLAALLFYLWRPNVNSINKMIYTKILGDLQIVYKDLVNHSVGKGPISHGYGTFVSIMFIFSFGLNFIGLSPYVFSATTHVALTIGLSFTIIAGSSIILAKNYNLDCLAIFTPENCPIQLAPFLVIIETVSQFSKVLSLGIRLAANITAGHLLLAIFCSFLFGFFINLPIMCYLPPVFCFMAVVGLEIAVAFIQAYVFCLLTCVYLGEGYHAH